MGNSLLNPFNGYTTNGTTNSIDGNGNASQAQYIVGRDLNLNIEAFGMGSQGRPDAVENLIINISQISANNSLNTIALPAKVASVQINLNDIISLMATNPNIPQDGSFTLKLTEVDVCNTVAGVSTPMKMLVLASQVYAPVSS